ncbi:MAG: hypothetical protein WBA57_13485 [Elainellaceae cyanobacterium]
MRRFAWDRLDQKKTTWGLAIALALLAAPGVAWADAGMPQEDDASSMTDSPMESHDGLPHGGMSQDGAGHHQPIEIPAGQPIPSVQLSVSEDPVSGWNLLLDVENFQFAPERVNQGSQPTEGHAHLYINGEKIMRVYGAWHHLPSLEPGTNEVTVVLNANGHEVLTYNGESISDTVIVSVP